MDLIKSLNEEYLKPELPPMNVGDTVRVTVRVKEGNRERNQAFEGTIIAKKHGGINETITVRRGKIRRAKLYYLRDKIGKKAKVKERV